MFAEDRKWCIRETAAANPLKEIEVMSFKSRDEPRFKGAATNINKTPKQPWMKRVGDLDGDFFTAFLTQTQLMVCRTMLSTKKLLMLSPDLTRLSVINLSILFTYKSTFDPDQKITYRYPLRILA